MKIRLSGTHWLDDPAQTTNGYGDADIILGASRDGETIELDVRGILIHVDAGEFRRALEALTRE